MIDTIKNTLNIVTDSLNKKSLSPRLDAELLLGKVFEKNRAWLYAHDDEPLNSQQQELIIKFLNRRLTGEPIAYLLEEKEFWNLTLAVNHAVLVPRPETEHMVEWVLELPSFQRKFEHSVLDLGVGSGALALALGVEKPDWAIDAVDISKAALCVAQQNAERHQIKNVMFYCSDWFQSLPEKKYDLIVSNPPYIAEGDPHLNELTYEPRLALTAGHTGLEAITEIIKKSTAFLQLGGYIAIEHGYDQAEAVRACFETCGFQDIRLHTDLAQLPRFTTARYQCKTV